MRAAYTRLFTGLGCVVMLITPVFGAFGHDLLEECVWVGHLVRVGRDAGEVDGVAAREPVGCL